MSGRSWQQLDPERAARASDARLQMHHAAQLATAIGISFLDKRADDSHTNLEWLPEIGALASRSIPHGEPFRIAMRPHPFALVALGAGDAIVDTLLLHAVTVDAAATWIRGRLGRAGFAPEAYTLASHYSIPRHPVDEGARFDASEDAEFAELGRWFANAALVLGDVAAREANASEVRCWPHHFDIATLITVAPGRSVGVGMEPGDGYYDEPYYYVNAYPSPASTERLPALGGNGHWHTSEWIGAVLPASSVSAVAVNAAAQREQIDQFVVSAVAACRALVTTA